MDLLRTLQHFSAFALNRDSKMLIIRGGALVLLLSSGLAAEWTWPHRSHLSPVKPGLNRSPVGFPQPSARDFSSFVSSGTSPRPSTPPTLSTKFPKHDTPSKSTCKGVSNIPDSSAYSGSRGTILPSSFVRSDSLAAGKAYSSSTSATKWTHGSSSTSRSSSRGPRPYPTSVTVGAAVNTTSGIIIGHHAPNATEVSEYLGIPYAQPPVGDLRFGPPLRFKSSATINASHYSADCPARPQIISPAITGRLGNLLRDLSQSNSVYDEDCLYANIWTKPQLNQHAKPVLVFIYGGGFNFGGSDSRAYSGQFFADHEDVVFVSFNYRTNILGFPGAPALTQNAGLLDQRMAIEWVRDNIAAFGGDPSRITIFGQSAGGASVDYYTYAWLEDPIIAGTIMHSGTAFSFATHDAPSAADNWYTASTALGCGNLTTSTAEEVLTCMRSPSITWQDLERVANTKTGLAATLGTFGPTVDEKTVFSDYQGLARQGKILRTPTVVGSCNYEAGLFILIAAGAGQTFPKATWDAIENVVFTCPASQVASARSSLGVPTWRYYYGGMYPNMLIPTVNISQAWHTSDIPVLFGTTETSSGDAPTQAEEKLGRYFRKAWSRFAADPARGLKGAPFHWPEYRSDEDTLILLGQDNATTASLALPSRIDDPAGCPSF